MTEFGINSWTKQLEKAVNAYNISFHRAINTSLYILKFGKIAILEIDKEWNAEEITITKAEAVKNRNTHFEAYKSSIEKGKRTVNYNLKIGDKVLIFNPLLSEKFKKKWHLVYKIVGFISPDAYEFLNSKKVLRLSKAHFKLTNQHEREEDRKGKCRI